MKLQHKLGQVALFSSALLVTIPMFNQLVPAAQAAPVTAKSADAFVDSIGVNIHLANTTKLSNQSCWNWAFVTSAMVAIKILHS